ncbi:MAG: PQQ-binding-like beta-propeller repeat protein, partial [Planctomycetota bacterium]
KAVSKNLVLRCDSCLARSLASIHFSERDGLAQQVISVAKFCDRSHLNKRARQAIETTSSASDLELLRDALKSDHASTREIAVAGLANLDKVGAEVLTSYLKQDVLDSLKLEIAIALLNANESYGLVALGELLETDDVDLRSNALSALVAVTGREKDDDLGEKEIADWQQWIESNYGSAKLTLPYVPLPEPRGRTLVCYLNGVVEEFDLNGRSTWKITIKGPAAACGCSNGHRLVASMQQKTVTEYDESGKSVWNISVDGHPSRVYRLDNGNTLVAMQQPGMVCEYRNDGSVAWKYASSSGVLDARRMQNGNTLVTLQDGRILQVRPSGESVWNLSGLSRPVSAQPLRNGNFLIAVSGDNAVVEYDSKQHIVWTRGSMNGILDAMRLPDGNTLVTKQTGVALYSPDGTSLDAGVPRRSSKNDPFSVNISGSYISRQSGQQVANRIFRY